MERRLNPIVVPVVIVSALLLICIVPCAHADRSEHSLNGEWRFQREGAAADAWKSVRVPGFFEQHEGTDFDGVGIYERDIALAAADLPPDARIILHIQAAATHAEVWFNGERLGEHLGGWTPFRFDVTPLVRARAANEPHTLRIRVDEMVGHNSQGFLPIIAPHFGGVWQDVTLLITSPVWIEDTALLAMGNCETGAIELDIPLRAASTFAGHGRVLARTRLLGTETWSERVAVEVAMEDGVADARMELPVPAWRFWSPADPALYEVELSTLDAGLNAAAEAREPLRVRAAFRTIAVDGTQLLLNGRPLSVRGLLNWGYAPPRTAPSVDEDWMRAELIAARERGFNLMKFCLWVPPKRYLELADELGMLTWMEYPTWHSKWTPDQLPKLEREFAEFFRYDRNHPSVVLRSLTCETGPSADLDVIRALYDMCHAMIPGSVVEDDSSWIQWNRIHDFYDDHPYGNNHTWVATLARLKHHIDEHGHKPLVLGEAIAADTWVNRDHLLEAVGDERPFWLPIFLDGNREWMDQMRAAIDDAREADNALAHLEADSKHYAMLMRKYQMEAYRREVQHGGYVVSVIRDFPLASMGLIDYHGEPKWAVEAWNWHGETMALLRTTNDRRSFFSGERLTAQVLVSHFGIEPIQDGELVVTVRADPDSGRRTIFGRADVRFDQLPGTLQSVHDMNVILPSVEEPMRVLVRVDGRLNGRIVRNRWPIWVVPQARSDAAASTADEPDSVIIAHRFTTDLLDQLEAGARVLMLPDGEPGSMPLAAHWFLRGGPFVVDTHPALEGVPRALLVEVQHFDLGGPVVPDVGYLDQVEPIVMLWDNHDIPCVKTHGLVFETRLGAGRLLVSALNHAGETNAVGAWLRDRFVDHLAHGPQPERTLTASTIAHMRAKIDERTLDLTTRTWRFRPDPEDHGLEHGWHEPSTDLDESWADIAIGRAWEGLGYASLDGWAWYRIRADIPDDWAGQNVYLSFEGVDDYYEVYINGERAGSGGDIETRQTAFEERASHDITRFITPGEPCEIAVRVYDWYGAGGLFRPVSLGTARIDAGVSILR